MLKKSSHGIVVNVLVCNILLSDVNLQKRNYFFRTYTNTLKKDMNPLFP